MARLSVFISLGLALAALPATLAGPACAKRNFKAADCVSKCATKWGWTGAMMNTDPWGSVVQKTDKEWNSVIAEACGVSVTSTSAPSATPSTASTGSAIPAAAAAGANPTLQSSSSLQSSSTTSSTFSLTTSSSALPTSSLSRTSSTISSKAAATSSSLVSAQTQGFLASTRARLITSTIARPSSTSQAVVQRPSSSSTTKKAAPTTSSANVATSTPVAFSGSGGTSSADIQAYLEAHNSIRAQHGAAPLTWSDNAASKAQQWANGCVFKHSGGSLGPFGENLAAGTGSSYGIAAAVKSWTDEVSQYDPSNPVPSHFTQVVWKGTTQVGCAVQSCSGIFAASFGPAKFFVCEYSAQGNIIGQFAQNVQV